MLLLFLRNNGKQLPVSGRQTLFSHHGINCRVKVHSIKNADYRMQSKPLKANCVKHYLIPPCSEGCRHDCILLHGSSLALIAAVAPLSPVTVVISGHRHLVANMLQNMLQYDCQTSRAVHSRCASVHDANAIFSLFDSI